ncbi:MAG: deaminase [Bdellovibrionales bacterium]
MPTIVKSMRIQHKARGRDALEEHRHWLKRAEEVAGWPLDDGGSPHPTCKVGAVLVNRHGHEIGAAANRFAKGVDRRRKERYENGSRSLWINCAEQFALAEALRKKADVKGATLYVTLEPCAICSGLIVEAGVARVCVPVGAMRRYARLKAKWKASIEIGMTKLSEGGVQIVSVDMPGDIASSRAGK